MTQVVIACPDIGNFKDVEVIDVLVKPGDQLELETPLITLETDKATMDVPASAAGKVLEVLVAKGGKVSQGTPIVKIEASASGPSCRGGASTRRSGGGPGATQSRAGERCATCRRNTGGPRGAASRARRRPRRLQAQRSALRILA